LTSPEPTDYAPSDFFPIFDMAMKRMNTNQTLTGDTTGLDYIYYIASQVSGDTQYDAQMLLRQLIAVPVGIFNDPTYIGSYPSGNLNTSGALAVPAYRVYAYSLTS
jgi:hypothetical protein